MGALTEGIVRIRANYQLLIPSEKKEGKSKGNADMFFIQNAVVGHLGVTPVHNN